MEVCAAVDLVFLAGRLRTNRKSLKSSLEVQNVPEQWASFSPWSSTDPVILSEPQQFHVRVRAGSIPKGCGGSPFIKAFLLSPSVLLYPGCDHRQPELNSACQSKKEDSFRRMGYPEIFLQMEISSCVLRMVRARGGSLRPLFFWPWHKKRLDEDSILLALPFK